MTSLPLDIHNVLEQEYEALHKKALLPSELTYAPADLVDEAWARTLLAECGMAGDDPLAVANGIINSETSEDSLDRLKDSRAMTDCGRQLLAAYRGTMGNAREIRRRIVDEALCGAVRKLRDARLGVVFDALHAEPDETAQSALCISGGGIRSATFALGILQGLASAGVLEKFHYLSTVSGGGYIGSWLSSWARRHPRGIGGVQNDLVSADTGVRLQIAVDGGATPRPLSEAKLNPEPGPLRHLRDYSNYLSPKLGFLSADTWSVVSLYLRNLLLNLLVIVPVLAAILALPRLYANLLRGGNEWAALTNWRIGAITVAALAVGFGYIGAARPVRHGRESKSFAINTNGWFLAACLTPLTVAGFGVSLFWARIAGSADLEGELVAAWPGIAWSAVAMTFVPFGIFYLRFAFTSFADRRQSARHTGAQRALLKVAYELIASVVGLLITAALLLLLATKIFPNPSLPVPDPLAVHFLDRVNVGLPMAELYVCLAVPLVLLVFFVQATVFVGLSSRFNEDNDREWWGRAGALLLMVAILGGGASFVAVFGPVLLYRAPMIVGSVGGVAGLVSVLLGYSAKTPAKKTKEEAAPGATAASALLGVAVPLFMLVVLAAISLGTTWLLQAIWYKPNVGSVRVDAQFVSTVTRTPPEPGAVRKDEAKVPTSSLEVARGVWHLQRIHATDRRDLALIGGMALLAVLLSRFIGSNRFSMHGLYKNRLIRAYLGASRYSRDPDRFTGFDENDDLQMYELRNELVWASSFTDPRAFVQALFQGRGAGVPKRLWDALDSKVAMKIEAAQGGVAQTMAASVVDAVIESVNLQMQSIDLATGKADGSPVSLLKKNRATLESAFEGTLNPLNGRRAPMHVVNTALNLVAGSNLAWQQRKAESFTITPFHCGSAYVGYRDAREYGGDDGISLGTAVAISGAAASPNMGYHSSVPLAFLLTLFNVRLGAWLGNPGLPGRKTFHKRDPHGNLQTLFYELTGSSNDRCPWVYLSDGGHFENLALYEMVLRRCRYIVVSDGGCDPKFSFEDLGNAVRKIRIDLGIPIDMREVRMVPRAAPGSAPREGSYVAVGTIRYSAIDGEKARDKDGTLIYLKPSIYSEGYLPRDVYNYTQQSQEFPHESTGDQFFSESQFESYRALGRHVVDVICGNDDGTSTASARTYPSLAAFAKDVRDRANEEAHRQTPNLVAAAFTAGSGQIAEAIRALPPGARLMVRRSSASAAGAGGGEPPPSAKPKGPEDTA